MKENKHRAILSAIPLIAAIASLTPLALSGCASTSIAVTALTLPADNIGELELSGIELESIYSYTQSLAEVEAIIVSSARKNGITIHPRDSDDAQKKNTVSIFIREQGYTKGFKTMLSLSIIADIRDVDGNAIMRAEWFHDGEESFDSLGYLASSLDETFRKISKAMRKSE